MTNAPRILRLRDVEARTGLKKSALYERIGNGDFPKPVKLGNRAVGFVEQEVSAWIAARVAARDAQS